MMNKQFVIGTKAVFVAAVLSVTGCQTYQQAAKMSQSGANAFSCEQIHGAFSAYDADRAGVEPLLALSKMVNIDSTAIAGTAFQTTDQYYQTMRNGTSTALALKGCSPL